MRQDAVGGVHDLEFDEWVSEVKLKISNGTQWAEDFCALIVPLPETNRVRNHTLVFTGRSLIRGGYWNKWIWIKDFGTHERARSVLESRLGKIVKLDTMHDDSKR